MLVASIIAYRLEGNSLEWSALMARFNYRPLYVAMTRFTGWLIGQGISTLPANLPAFINPQTVWTQETINAATGGLCSNWFLFFFLLVLLVITVVGEEFWWRGFILPLSLGLTFAVLYLNNSSAGLVMHFISNGVGLVPILLGVLQK